MTIPSVEAWIVELQSSTKSVNPQPLISRDSTVIAALRDLESGSYPPGTFSSGEIIFAAADGSLTGVVGLVYNSVTGSIESNTGNLANAPASVAASILTSAGTTGSNNTVTFNMLNTNVNLISNRYNGTFGAPTTVLNANTLFQCSGNGWGATQLAATNPIAFQMLADENWSDTARGTQFRFLTTLNGTLTRSTVLTIKNDGSVLGFPAASYALGGAAASATVPSLIPNRAALTTGIGAQAAGNVSVILAGAEAVRFVSTAITQQMVILTVATLPAAAAGNAGARAFVSDALAPAFSVVVAGGGAVFVPVYSDGAAWRCG